MAGHGKLTYNVDGEDPEPPDDRLARLANAGRRAIEAHPEHQAGDKLVIVVTGPTDSHPGFASGPGLFAEGYDGADDIIDTLVQNLEALFEAKTGRPSAIILRRLEDLWRPSLS